MEDSGVFARDHFGGQPDFHRAAVAGVGDKIPDGGRTGIEGREIFEIERREKPVGVDPHAEALDKNMAVHGHGGIQIGAERTVVFGIDPAKVNAKPRHAANAVRQ